MAMDETQVAQRVMDASGAPFVIAEAGINHNGDLSLAKRMVDVAAESGVDAVKFQTFKTEDFVMDRSLEYTYRSQGAEVTESMFDMFKRTEFTGEEWEDLKAHCDERGIVFLSTPVTMDGARFLRRLGVGALKVGSDDFTNTPLIKDFASLGVPVMLSCGMADEAEIKTTLSAAFSCSPDICLMLCTSEYPTPPASVNIRKLLRLRELFPDLVLGFSDHTQGHVGAVLAVGYGAHLFEKHFTLDHDLPGPDHWFSSEPAELRTWASAIREAHEMLGCKDLAPTASEMEMRTAARRSVVARTHIQAGDVLDELNTCLRRPGNGVCPERWSEVLGHTALRDIEEGSLILFEDLS